jgi:hypothetical protein
MVMTFSSRGRSFPAFSVMMFISARPSSARCVVILTSSVRGELDRRLAVSRRQAFSIAHQVLVERETAELCKDPAPLHGEVISIVIESDSG